MPDADNHVGERSFDEGGSGRQRRANNKHKQAVSRKEVEEESLGDSKNENQENRLIKNDKKEVRNSRGPEDWGGYEGF